MLKSRLWMKYLIILQPGKWELIIKDRCVPFILSIRADCMVLISLHFNKFKVCVMIHSGSRGLGHQVATGESIRDIYLS